ncbi:MAG: alpha/beta hydrolase [Burkholderiaceae bacterium]
MSEPTLHHLDCPDSAGHHRMAWWQWGAVQAPHVIVCVHGLSRQGRDFDVLARALVACAAMQGLGVRVVCPDVVGRGQSAWLQDAMGYQYPTYVADTLTLLARLHAQAPIATLDWVGTSMGGIIGMLVAGTPGLPLPVALRRLVLNDVGPTIEWQAIQRIRDYVGKGPERFESVEAAAGHLRALSTGFGPISDADWLRLTRPMLQPLPEGGWRLCSDPAIAVPMAGLTAEALAQGDAILWRAYEQIKAQVLLLRGADSDLLAPATARRMAASGPHARLIEFAGVGHAPMLIADDQVQAVTGFLLPGPGGARP